MRAVILAPHANLVRIRNRKSKLFLFEKRSTDLPTMVGMPTGPFAATFHVWTLCSVSPSGPDISGYSSSSSSLSRWLGPAHSHSALCEGTSAMDLFLCSLVTIYFSRGETSILIFQKQLNWPLEESSEAKFYIWDGGRGGKKGWPPCAEMWFRLGEREFYCNLSTQSSDSKDGLSHTHSTYPLPGGAFHERYGISGTFAQIHHSRWGVPQESHRSQTHSGVLPEEKTHTATYLRKKTLGKKGLSEEMTEPTAWRPALPVHLFLSCPQFATAYCEPVLSYAVTIRTLLLKLVCDIPGQQTDILNCKEDHPPDHTTGCRKQNRKKSGSFSSATRTH